MQISTVVSAFDWRVLLSQYFINQYTFFKFSLLSVNFASVCQSVLKSHVFVFDLYLLFIL